MRILYFSRDYNTHDRRFLASLAGTEHEVYYLRLENRGLVLEDRPLPPSIRIVLWSGGQGPVSLSDGLRLLLSLKRVIRKIHPDVIQAGPLQTAAFLTALAGFSPLISMSWGYDLLHDVNRNALWKWATRYTLQHSAAMVGDCNTIRQLAIQNGIPNDRIVTFPWGVDLDRYHPAESDLRARLGWGKDCFVLLSTRGWEPIYGVDTIARAFIQIAQKHPELRLLMLGNGSQAALFRQIFLQAGLLEQVHFPGIVNQVELPRYYQSADLYISASHSDGSSISLLEAMACAKPCLVSDIPGNREWIEPGVQGWWFQDGNTDDLAKNIELAIDQRQHLLEMGCAAHQLALQKADWRKNFPQLFKAYELATRSS